MRGCGVDLGETVVVLRKTGQAEQVVAVPWPVADGSADGVVAFVSGGSNLDDLHILNGCREVLPDYMVPRKIYRLEEMPLNDNRKIDRKKLVKLLEGA